jgi:hypothetical protein
MQSDNLKQSGKKAMQAGIGLAECLITLLVFSVVTANACTMFVASLRTVSLTNNHLRAARLATDATTLNGHSPGKLQQLAKQVAQNLPEGSLEITQQESHLTIQISWSEPGHYEQTSYVAHQHAD